MKKFYIACTALLLSFLFVFTSCISTSSTALLDYLPGKQFSEQSAQSGNRVNLTVKEDRSYTLSVSYVADGLESYKAEGTKMEYLGTYEKPFTYTWLGVTLESVSYYHVVKLPEATVESYGKDYTFHLVGMTTSQNTDSFSLSLVYCKEWDSDADTSANLNRIINSSTSVSLQKR